MAENLSSIEKKLEEVVQRLDTMEKRLTVAEDIEQIMGSLRPRALRMILSSISARGLS